MADIMHANSFDPGRMAAPINFVIEIVLCDREDTILLLHSIEGLDVFLHFLTEEFGHLNDTVALFRLRSGNHVLALEPLIGFADGHCTRLKVEVCWGEGQQFPLPDTAPVEHFKGIVGEGLVHHGVGKFQILFLRPEQHFTPFLHPHVPGLGRRIDLEAVVADSMVKEGT